MRRWKSLTPLCLLVFAGCMEPLPEQPVPSPEPTFECEAASFRAADVNITIQTTKGEIGAVLYGGQSPITVCNYLRYVESDYYDGTIWHRICTHVIQAGGQDTQGRAKQPYPPIPNEANESRLRNYARTFGMARSSEPDSAQAHFFINLKDNLYLDYDGPYAPGYAVFGNVTRGWDVVQEIAKTQTQPTPPDPTNPLANPGCEGRPVPTLETIIRDIQIQT